MATKLDYMLNNNDPNKTRINHFLNQTGENLIKINWDHRTLKEADKILYAYKYESDDHALTLTVISATSYHDANRIAEVNGFYKVPQGKCGINGDILYIAESSDEDKVNDIVSLFAGKE